MVCRLYGGQAKITAGFPTYGARLVEEAVVYARRGDNIHSLAWALAVASHVFQIHNEAAAAARFASEAIETARDHNLPQWLALGERCMGWANASRRGQLRCGPEPPAKGVRRWNETGATLHTTPLRGNACREFSSGGSHREARAHQTAARALREEIRRSVSCRRNRTIGEFAAAMRTGCTRDASKNTWWKSLHIARRQGPLFELPYRHPVWASAGR